MEASTCKLELVREDDFVEYFLFPQIPDNEFNESQCRNYLHSCLVHIKGIADRIIQERSYIWHKDEFNLTIRMETEQLHLVDDQQNNEGQQVILPPHLHGVTHYGENIADEWFIVFLLYEITRESTNCISRVVDSDGEFLLIEAADALPKWANPETCEQRVYISNGHLHLVQNSPSNTSTSLPIGVGLAKIRQNPTLYKVCKEIQDCILVRLKEFQDVKNHSLHKQIVRVPLGVAALLKENPSLIAAACRAFCERDPIDMKACRAMRFFPPENRVRINVTFTRCLYAMITQTNYLPDRRIGWKLSSVSNSETYKEDLLGVKIACGFEILASQAKAISCHENDPSWKAYLKSLTSKGYFRDNIEGSRKYEELLKEAKSFYQANQQRFRTASQVGQNILDLLKTLEISADHFRDEEQNNLLASESDDWLNISPDQLDSMLNEKYGMKKLYSLNGGVDANEFTKNISDFLDQKSEFDGIENASGDENHGDKDSSFSGAAKSKIKKNLSMRKAIKENPINTHKTKQKNSASSNDKVNFDPDSFTTHVKSFLDFVIPEDRWDSNSEMSDYEDEEDLEKNIEEMTNSEMNIQSDIKAYMDQMDKELSKTTIGKTFDKHQQEKFSNRRSAIASDDDFDDIESFQPIDINVNTLKNMMDSYKSQIGGAGPVKNLLSAMGIGMEIGKSTDATNNEDIIESKV